MSPDDANEGPVLDRAELKGEECLFAPQELEGK